MEMVSTTCLYMQKMMIMTQMVLLMMCDSKNMCGTPVAEHLSARYTLVTPYAVSSPLTGSLFGSSSSSSLSSTFPSVFVGLQRFIHFDSVNFGIKTFQSSFFFYSCSSAMSLVSNVRYTSSGFMKSTVCCSLGWLRMLSNCESDVIHHPELLIHFEKYLPEE